MEVSLMNKIINIAVAVAIGINLFKAPIPFEATTIEERAASVGLTVEEFTLFSGVVEAESNRDPDNIEGRVYIALTIWNRASEDHPEFGNTVTEVLTSPGQFSTVVNGHSITSRTDLSDQAVIAAYEWIHSGEEYPEVLFFNCRGYFSWREDYNPDRDGDGTPDGAIGGNYFSL